MEQHDFPDRMFIDFEGVKAPCLVEARLDGRRIASRLVYGEQTGGRLIIYENHEPDGGVFAYGETIQIAEGAEIQLGTPYAKPPYTFPPVWFRPSYRAQVQAE